MKKILSVLLTLAMMISLCSAFALTATAEESVFLADEYDATALGFTADVYEGGREGVAEADRVFASQAGGDYEALKWLYENGYDKDHNKKGNTYYIYKDSEEAGYSIHNAVPTDGTAYGSYEIKSDNLVSKQAFNPHYGGYWIASANTSLPINKFPLDIDAHLSDDGTTISGVRIYPRKDSDYSGYIKTYEVWVKFVGDNTWTYLYTDGNKATNNSTTNKPVITTNFGYNAKVTDVRIRVVEGSSVVGKADMYVKAGTTAYVNLSAVTFLKPYGTGEGDNGVSYSVNGPKTVTKADEIDEIMSVTKASVVRVRGGNAKYGMDGDLSTSSNTNGQLSFDFGETVRFSGIRIYPPKQQTTGGNTDQTYYRLMNGGLYSTLKPLNLDKSYDKGSDYSDEFGFWSRSYVIKSGLDGQKIIVPTNNGAADPTKPITIMFKADLTARSIYLDGWGGSDGGDVGNTGIGEIRLIKPYEETDPYLSGTLDWTREEVVTSNPANNSLQTYAMDGFVCGTPEYGNSTGMHTDYDHKLQNGGTVTITVNLGEKRTFSGLRVVGRVGQTNQSVTNAILSVSDDGENWVEAYEYRSSGKADSATRHAWIYAVTDNIYTDILARNAKQCFNVTAQYVKLQVLDSDSHAHFSTSEIALLAPNDEYNNVTVTEFAAKTTDAIVPGSLEHQKSIGKVADFVSGMNEAAKAEYDASSSSLESTTVKENDYLISAMTGSSEHKANDGCGTADAPSTMSAGNVKQMIDGFVNGDIDGVDIGGNTFTRGDFCVQASNNESLNLNFAIDGSQVFSGIRFYARRQDNFSGFTGGTPKKVQVKLNGTDGKSYVMTGEFETAKSADGRYVDLMLNFNGSPVKVSGVASIDVEIMALHESAHFGAEEVRLLTDTSVTNTSTLAEISKGSVVLGEITADTGVLDGKGIIRFITEFTKIADGAEIESFGTYAISTEKGEYSEANVTLSAESIGVYNTATAGTPNVNDTFAVDVTDIPEGKFNVPVTAVSFVKVKGYDNLIIFGVKTGVTVDGERQVQMPTVTPGE